MGNYFQSNNKKEEKKLIVTLDKSGYEISDFIMVSG